MAFILQSGTPCRFSKASMQAGEAIRQTWMLKGALTHDISYWLVFGYSVLIIICFLDLSTVTASAGCFESVHLNKGIVLRTSRHVLVGFHAKEGHRQGLGGKA